MSEEKMKTKSNWLRDLDIREEEKDKAVLDLVMPHVYKFVDTLETDNPTDSVLVVLLKSILSFFINKTEMTERRPEHFEEALSDYFKTTDMGLPEKVFMDDPKTLSFTDESISAFYELKTATDWNELTPMVYSVIFESLLNSNDRKKGGMHYTSAENIHKVIDPLFLDELIKELDAIGKKPVKEQLGALEAFRKKLGELQFLDPACGSGNFLFTAYQDLRRLENKAIEMEMKLKRVFEWESALGGLIRDKDE